MSCVYVCTKLNYMKRALYATVFLTSLMMWSCNYSEQPVTVNADNRFSLTVPSWLEEDKKLKEGAEFQYANRFRNFYAIGEVIKDAKPGSDLKPHLDGYLKLLTDTAVMKGALVSDSTAINIGNARGVRVEVFGKMSDENIYFSEVVLSGSKGLYHLSLWTRSEERKLHFKGQIDSIIYSFREI